MTWNEKKKYDPALRRYLAPKHRRARIKGLKKDNKVILPKNKTNKDWLYASTRPKPKPPKPKSNVRVFRNKNFVGMKFGPPRDKITGEILEFGKGEFSNVSGEKELYIDPYSFRTTVIPKELVTKEDEPLDDYMKKSFLIGREKAKYKSKPKKRKWVLKHYEPKEEIAKPVSKIATDKTELKITTNEPPIKFYEGVPLDVNFAYDKLQDKLPFRYRRGLRGAVDLGKDEKGETAYKVFTQPKEKDDDPKEFYINIGKDGEIKALSKYGDFNDIKIKDEKVYELEEE